MDCLRHHARSPVHHQSPPVTASLPRRHRQPPMLLVNALELVAERLLKPAVAPGAAARAGPFDAAVS